MRVVLFLTLLLSALFGDIYVVSGDKKVKMTPLTTGVVDYSGFDTIATIKRDDRGIHALAVEKNFEPRHANFRIVTLDFPQSNMTIINWNKKISETTYEIEFDNFTTDDGVMFQLFYHNRWYAAILGEPLEVLEKLFSQKNLDPKKAYEAIQDARKAFSKSKKLQELEKLWQIRAERALDPNAKYKKQEKIDFKKIPKEK